MLKLCQLFCLFLILKLGFGAETPQTESCICGLIDPKYDIELKKDEDHILTRGSWPWLVGIVVKTGRFQTNSRFRCAGTLISNRTVVTTATCLYNNSIPLNADDLKVYLGQTQEVTVHVENIQIHERYKHARIPEDSNIAVLTLKNDVIFSEFIRPACISNQVQNDKVNVSYFAGWGPSYRDGQVPQPRRVSVTVVNNLECFLSNSLFTETRTETSFCAGDKNGFGPCRSDSGSGLLVQSNGRWTLLGLTVGSLVDPITFACNLFEYAIYTKVEMFYNWIREIQLRRRTNNEVVEKKVYNISVENCSSVSESITPLAVGGVEIPRGSWPWLVAIYGLRRGSTTLKCGGTLISPKAIVTAAHCFLTRRSVSRRYLGPSEVQVVLGRYDIDNPYEEGTVSVRLKNIHIHEDYNPGTTTFDSDIAVITLTQEVAFTEYIQPACVWNVDDDVSGQLGYAAGWGRSGRTIDEQYTSTPRKISATLVDDASCFRSNSALLPLTSPRTICAGNRNGTGPCIGDSGGGLLIKKDNRWHLRAIVAVSLGDPIDECNLHEYVVYSDVADFLEWIENVKDECGIPDRKFISEPVPGTEEILQQGEWPWLAAIYVHTTGSQSEFRCGGSIISSQIVITGALCLFNNGVPLKPENLNVYLGQTNLDSRKEEFTYPVKEIHIHKNYNHSIISRDSNIGALKLSRKVRFSNVIKPVCITDSPKNDYVNQAFIAGWGRRDRYNIDNRPRRVSATVIGRRQCLSSNPIYEKLVSLTSFCAGDRNGLGPCLGDSGNGLMIKQNGRWILYGIATTALADPETKLCLPNEYVVYTSVEKFYPWINAIEMNTPFGTRMSNPSKTYDLNVENCGDSSSFIRLIFKGSEIIRGSWPWLVPIYKTKGAVKFICGGTLISKTAIISAAHCFKDGNISLEPKDLLIPIGRYDLDLDSSEDVQKIPIQVIHVHRDYNPGVLTSDADIALIVLSRNVRFTEFVRPACIWNVDDDAEGETGYVAGWGRVNKNKDRSARPRSIQATVVPETKCLRSGEAYRQITSHRTFCAGELDGSGPCSGDSGGGLLVLKNGRWHLRGIVSISLLKALHECDLHNYVVYTDVAKHLDWIKKIIDKL